MLGLRNELTAQPPSAGPVPDPDSVPVQIYGHHALVGPFTRTGTRTGPSRPCRTCLARRWQSVRPRRLRDALELGTGTTATHPTPHVTPFTVTALSALVAAHRESAPPGPPGTPSADVYEVDLRTLEATRHRLLADADCPACSTGVPEDPPTAAITLHSTPGTC